MNDKSNKMNDKEKLQVEITRVRLVLSQVEYSGAQVRAAMIRFKVREAGRVLLMGNEEQAQRATKELEGIV